MDAWKTGRTMTPRPQQGTSLLVSMQMMATDEGILLGRVAFRDPGTGKVTFAHAEKTLWDGGLEGNEHFASELAAAVWDAVAWTVS